MKIHSILLLIVVAFSPLCHIVAQPLLYYGKLDSRLSGCSSMLYFNDTLWATSDHGTLTIYALNNEGVIIDSLPYLHPDVVDMEDMAQDDNYIYLGDFGNNYARRRTLHILRYRKSDLYSSNPQADTIFFSYADQTAFDESSLTTDYDCEAFVADKSGNLYVFTKQYSSHATSCYCIPGTPGSYSVSPVVTLPVDGLVTGADITSQCDVLFLLGYSQYMQPFVVAISHFDHLGSPLATATMRRFLFDTIISQTEAIAVGPHCQLFIGSEQFSQFGVTLPSQLRGFDASDNCFITAIGSAPTVPSLTIIPNPTSDRITVHGMGQGSEVSLYDLGGHRLLYAIADANGCIFNVANLPAGSYMVWCGGASATFVKH